MKLLSYYCMLLTIHAANPENETSADLGKTDKQADRKTNYDFDDKDDTEDQVYSKKQTCKNGLKYFFETNQPKLIECATKACISGGQTSQNQKALKKCFELDAKYLTNQKCKSAIEKARKEKNCFLLKCYYSACDPTKASTRMQEMAKCSKFAKNLRKG